MDKKQEKPQDCRETATKKPASVNKEKREDKEARLAAALRANLRRRKAGPTGTDKKDN
ncbi:hypothetical protein ABFZ85_02455 [Hyphococcus formosus]|uniref:hypothetical protein n=1 Tax=Hyphococcus formosus TaxID=3143534 RepID=UPI00398B0A17